MFRYCDDIIICCNSPHDANNIIKALTERLRKYKLQLKNKKTKVVSFSIVKLKNGQKQGAFDFLGFTWYLGRSLKRQYNSKSQNFW